VLADAVAFALADAVDVPVVLEGELRSVKRRYRR
jgi:hypothetical protein